jgi:hypothetical protein
VLLRNNVLLALVLLRYHVNEINKPFHSNGHVPIVAYVEVPTKECFSDDKIQK